MSTKIRLVLSTTILFLSFCGYAQTNYWEVAKSKVSMERSLEGLDVSKTQQLKLHQAAFKQLISTNSASKVARVVHFPESDGSLVPFEVTLKQVMAPELAAKFPNIRSYAGRSLRNPKDIIYFSVSPLGIQSMIVHGNGQASTFMQPVSRGSDRYAVYNRGSRNSKTPGFICKTMPNLSAVSENTGRNLVDDQTLRKYRLAVSATGEYTVYHGGTVADAMAAINATVTIMNPSFETDLGVTLELIPNTDQVVYTNPNTDPYTNNLNSETQNTLTSVIGEANYDVGILFDQDDNSFDGNAGFIGSVCVDNQKGSAYATLQEPEGDIYAIDLVAHEIGHQFGANHTWSFETEGTTVQVEPGSGSTIMAYAGIVPGENVQSNSDPYFSYVSILQITEYLATVSCAEEIALTNNPPTVTPISNFSIPRGTAFMLTGDATDVDTGDVLTYCWEQIDNGVVNAGSFGPNNPAGANFRSLNPTTSPERYFPRLSRVVSGNLTQTNPGLDDAWETVSDIERELSFALTVRDNASGGGQVVSELVTVNVSGSSGPFEVTSQAGSETYEAGTIQTVSWNVNGTDQNPVNAQTVDIFLSTDGGLSFPTLLAQNILNDGSHEVLLPGIATTSGRIMVQASNNIFFAVNSSNFTITEAQVVLNFGQLSYDACQPSDLVIPFIYETYMGFNEEVTFSATGLPAGLGVVFSPVSATANNTPVTITFSNTAGVAIGEYDITIEATSASLTKTLDLEIGIYDANFSEVVLSSPADGAVDQGVTVPLVWEANEASGSYEVEIATDASFANIVATAEVFINTYIPNNLNDATTYFWRVKPKNSCGEGTFGTPFSFTTITVNCKSISATGLPIAISPTGTPTVTSTVTFVNDLTVADVNVSLDVSHSFLADLVIRLTSPAGTTVILTANSCGDLSNINATFDDDAPDFICTGNPGISGTVSPLGTLASFNGESTFGDWTLEIMDTAPADGGTLNNFTLELCAEGVFRPDDDNDGVFDDGDDLCLGTPPGTEVDTDGCPVFRFPSNNFTVALQSESCKDNNDGAIEITAMQSLNYTVTINGNGVDVMADFTESYQLGNLSSGSYTICITGTDGTNTFEALCFDAVVAEPDSLGVSSTLLENGVQAFLTLSGASLYNIELNGILTQTSASEVTLDLKKGINTLVVSTNKLCQGVYEEQLFASDQPILHPNPFHSVLSAFVGSIEGPVKIVVHDSNGRLVSNHSYQPSGNEIQLDLSALQAGMYFVRFQGAEIKGTFKVIKQ